MSTANYPSIDLDGMKRIIRNSVKTKRPAMFLGHPGIGKTEVCGAMAKELGLSLAYLELGLTVPEEIGGVPVRTGEVPGQSLGALVRLPLGPIAQACTMPTLLVVDEVTRADPMRQGAAMTGVNERRWGDYHLHPNSAVVLCGNLPESGGTFSILDALLNRCGVYRTGTTPELVRAYLSNLGEPDSRLRHWASTWAFYAESRGADLIACEPPSGFSESGALWASPRAIHHACQRMAASDEAGLDVTDEIGLAELCGVVGQQAAVAFMTLRRLANKLPSAREIQANPTQAKLPEDVESSIAVYPTLLEVVAKDADAAWIYLDRLCVKSPDIGRVSASRLFQLTHRPKTKEGFAVFTRRVGEMSKLLKEAHEA